MSQRIIQLIFFTVLLCSCNDKNPSQIQAYHFQSQSITDTTTFFYHEIVEKNGLVQIITPFNNLNHDDPFISELLMFWPNESDQPELDLEESCLVQITTPDTITINSREYVIQKYDEECGPIDGLRAIYYCPQIGPIAALYHPHRSTIFEYKGMEEITEYLKVRLELNRNE